MSRIGKKPITLPKGVEITVNDNMVTVKGPKGTLSQAIPQGITVARQDD
ncbi:MAG: 50S ribosomal protein L6, partial [Bacillota bacterium]|nr:50S ribosomal protein L6 [Bacillota bacterium]